MLTNKKSKTPIATPQTFPVVGVGASAGGLEAFKQFLKAVPENSGMAYVLVQHLDPSHDSILAEILSKVTSIPISEITDDIHIAPNHIYVIPENQILTSTDGVLKLAPREKFKTNLTIDVFFTSLAEVHQDLAIGVVLSGNGSDGMLGLQAIKAYGGTTFAQDPKTAANVDMPEHAIAAGVDYILPPNEIPEKLMALLEQAHQTEDHSTDENVFQDIILLLRQHSGVDFTYYKQTTIRRRIARRMAISKSENLSEYLKLLRKDKAAPGVLFNDLLIPVTSFFRDPKIFLDISKVVFPAIAKNKSAANSIRIWIAGCSTGEEAYTLAIMLHEFLGENLTGTQVQIFASDISEIAIAKARIGFYSKSQLLQVSDAILKKYFTKTNTGYQVNRQIRDVCVFAVHNFLKDPPFAKMDLITCRNVLIYMDPYLQKKSLGTFHYALRDGGFLLLGKSETTSPADDLFAPLEKTSKIYTRNSVIRSAIQLNASNNREQLGRIERASAKAEISKPDFRKSAELLLLSKYTPASVVINDQMDIVDIRGNITPYLEAPQGKPTFNLLKMAREGLAFELRNALRKTKETGSTTVKECIPLKIGGKTIEITVEIVPLTETAEPYFLILFYRTVAYKLEVGNIKVSDKDLKKDENLKRILQLETELAQTHEDVNAITEDQDAFYEELQSANEELMSSSEELQSLNEELETSKEEMQSSNEELIIINQELLDKQDIINTSRDYTEAIIATLREPIVVLDAELRIKNINRSFTKKFIVTKLEAEGKLFYEIQNSLFDNAVMRKMLEKVLPNKIQIDDYEIAVDLPPFDQSTLLLNARQITNEKSKEQLILLAIEDITERKLIDQRLKAFSDELEIKIDERTADLLKSNLKLKASIKESLQANIQLQQFAYVASHDLQEPLRKILMFTSRLEEFHEKLPKQAIALLDKINHSSDRMKRLIQDLLDYSYLNNHEELFVPTDLNVILQNIISDFELMIEQKNVVIKSNILPVIFAIPLQMNQLFYNLISNALKFCGEDRTPRLTITVRKLSASQIRKHPSLNPELSYCEIVFKDNGIGFEQQYEHQIFTVFQRLHSNEAYVGTGIGLAIGKKIIENHQGEIFAKSKKGHGAAFHIILPLNQPKETAALILTLNL